jgi:hypothetical protein
MKCSELWVSFTFRLKLCALNAREIITQMKCDIAVASERNAMKRNEGRLNDAGCRPQELP